MVTFWLHLVHNSSGVSPAVNNKERYLGLISSMLNLYITLTSYGHGFKLKEAKIAQTSRIAGTEQYAVDTSIIKNNKIRKQIGVIYIPSDSKGTGL